MNNILFTECYNNINRKLLSQRWLTKCGISKSVIEIHTKKASFKENLLSIINENDYSCKKVLKLCKSMLDALAYPNIPNDWLSYIYQYTLNKSFPEAVNIILIDSLVPSCELYLRVLKVTDEAQKSSKDNTWQSLYAMNFLSPEEVKSLEHSEEYSRFLKAFKNNYTYELMKLNSETLGFNTLDHVCGVHSLALFIARQLKKLKVPVDLGRVSGSAAGHDLGKYGCRLIEIKRVPYLHYYYSDQWFKKYNINYIRNIAINHSTWDLELENLSLESLILIYSDFRVKNKDSFKDMHIFNLQDSFQVILNKLDNLDEAKEKRYRRVYEKLKDFEDYMLNLGVNTEMLIDSPSTINLNEEKTNFALMKGQDIIQNLKFLSINHNINLMYLLRDEYSLDTILESARSEKDWKNSREYLRIFEEYSTYFTQTQKLQTIKFLFENTTHPEDDIRRHCAELIGNLIALYDEDYRKEIPENVKVAPSQITSLTLFKEYLELLLSPGYKIIPIHRSWMGYTISRMVKSLFSSCRASSIPLYRDLLLSYYGNKLYKNTETQLFLLETAKFIPLTPQSENLDILFNYLLLMTQKRNNNLRLASLEVTLLFVEKLPNTSKFIIDLITELTINHTRSKSLSENLIKLKIVKLLNLEDLINIYVRYCDADEKDIPLVFLSNLKSATDWIKKKNQVDLLLQYAIKNPTAIGLHTSIHFCNLLKVSAVEGVRNTAGAAILTLMPFLTLSERNEVSVELLRALEMEGDRFTEYIPKYFGQMILWLQPKELDEIIDDLAMKIKISKSNIKSLILKTIAIAISYYPHYLNRFGESTKRHDERLSLMLGILLNGLGDYDFRVKQAAFSVLGKDIFGTKNLDLSQKEKVFKLIAKKLLNLITDNNNEDLLFLSNSAGLNHIYRFISDYNFFLGEIQLTIPEKVAFFPGTFDPFSLSHKEIAKHIRDLGFEVYLAVDEFSWSKKTLPNQLRKKIISMSVADELNIYIYPDSFPTSLSNPKDLNVLKENFEPSTVFIVVGSDVVLNASSYKKQGSEGSIHNLPHIIFERGKNKKLEEASRNITGEIVWLSLPTKYSNISSTQIRNYIDGNRDISVLIDPLAEQYIYQNGFYQRESQEKDSLKSLWIKAEVIEVISDSLINEMSMLLPTKQKELLKYIKESSEKDSGRFLLLRDELNNNDIIGFSMFHWVRSNMLYKELNSVNISKFLRETSFGRITFIEGLFVKASERNKNIEQILITETLAFCVSKDYEFAIFKPAIKELSSMLIYDALRLQGFKELTFEGEDTSIHMVDMSTPCILNFDVENVIKEPFRSSIKVKQVIASTRRKLQEELCTLYPGELLLPFDSNMLNQSIIRKICFENGVQTEFSKPAKLGDSMCVPYGDILDRYVIPNTVTKALHTEKQFLPDMKSFKIAQFPHYLDLKTQVKMLNSFNRPVILVDNIIHKGYRLKTLDPLINGEGVVVKKIVAGILSGRGKDLMDMQKREVDSVYFIPKLKLWFNEDALYPFIGGETLWRGVYAERNLIPSINLILPYTSPDYIRNTSAYSIFRLSKICIENSLSILDVLEEEYHILNERNLTLASLGQVFTLPRCPDHGKNIEYDLNLTPSHYLKNDLELLNRLESIIHLTK